MRQTREDDEKKAAATTTTKPLKTRIWKKGVNTLLKFDLRNVLHRRSRILLLASVLRCNYSLWQRAAGNKTKRTNQKYNKFMMTTRMNETKRNESSEKQKERERKMKIIQNSLQLNA